jgi:hypothetical protein
MPGSTLSGDSPIEGRAERPDRHHRILIDVEHVRMQIGGYAGASYASGGGGASRVPGIAGDVTAGPALVSCVLVSHSPCAERRRF